MEDQKEDKGFRVRNTPKFKLKDRVGRTYQPINLLKQFGFIPEVIIVEKVRGANNAFFVRAILTDEEIKKEEIAIKNLKAVEPQKGGDTHGGKKNKPGYQIR